MLRTEEFNDGYNELILEGYNRESSTNKIRLLRPLIADLCIKEGYVWIGDKHGHFAQKKNGYYNPDVFQRLSKDINEYYGLSNELIGDKAIDEVRSNIQRLKSIPMSRFENIKKYINLTNGVVPLWGPNAWTLIPHPEDLMTMIQIPHNYNEDALCNKWDKFMKTVADATDEPFVTLDTLWEIMGYCMQFSVKLKKAFFLISKESNTGKSTYINVLDALLGEENTSKIRLDKLTNLGFGGGGAAHKLLNYFDDLPRYIKVDTLDIWKSQIDGKAYDYEKKHENATKHPNILKQLYAANGLPSIAWDLTITVRLVIIVFKHIFGEGELIPHWEFKEIISDENEMEGIVRKAIMALKRLFERGYFRTSSDEELLHTLRLETDVIYQFIFTCCNTGRKTDEMGEPIVDGDLSNKYYVTRQSVLYARFTYFQDLTGNTSDITKRIFTKALKRMGIPVKQFHITERSEMSKIIEVEEHVVVYRGAQFNSYPGVFEE